MPKAAKTVGPALLVVCAALAFLPAPGPGTQGEIRILVVNGKNGKRVTGECINVFAAGRSMLLPVNRAGLAVLPIAGVVHSPPLPAPEGRLCRPRTLHPEIARDGSFRLAGDYYVACQEYTRQSPASPGYPGNQLPVYSVKAVLRTGVVASNTCGKVRVKAKPGELVFFERPMTFWEKLRE